LSERVRIAAIDIGSDTVHLLIADVTARRMARSSAT